MYSSAYEGQHLAHKPTHKHTSIRRRQRIPRALLLDPRLSRRFFACARGLQHTHLYGNPCACACEFVPCLCSATVSSGLAWLTSVA